MIVTIDEPETRLSVLLQVTTEIRRGREKHGQNSAGAPGLPLGARFAILAEEYAELTKEFVDSQFVSFTDKPAALERVKSELTQVAAVSIAILEAMEAQA